jgi:hypothetical protein
MPRVVKAQEAITLMLGAGFEPLAPFVNSRTPWKSTHIKCGNIVEPTYGAIKAGRRGCRHCSNRKLNHGYALGVMRNAGLEPKVPFTNTDTKWESIHIECGATVFPKFKSVQEGHSGCKPCSDKEKREVTRVNQPNLISQEEALKIARNADLEPLEPYLNTKTNWKCRCKICNDIVHPKLGLLKSRGQRSCKTCKKNSRGKGKYSQVDAQNLLAAAGRSPLEPYLDTTTPWKSICLTCGTIGTPTLVNIKRRGNSCIKCGSIRSTDAKKITQVQAERIYQEGGMKLLEEYPHINSKPLRCQCLNCERIVERPIASVKRSRNGCEYCAGTMVDPEEAKALMIANGYDPQIPYPGTDEPWSMQHLACGFISEPTYGTIKRGGGGCRHCAQWGWDNTKPSYLYLITHTELEAHKVGIANVAKMTKSDRLHKFQNHGWQVYEKWEFPDGHNLLRIEAEIFRILRKEMGIPRFLAKGQMKYQGESETVSAELISLPALERVIKKVIKGFK